jgi:hypothetical protein
MKVAVVLFGHLRTYDQTCSALQKYLLGPYKADVYIHTWSSLDRTTESYKEQDEFLSLQTTHLANIKMAYPDSVVEIEDPLIDVGELDYYKERSILGLKSMFHSIGAGIDLVLQSGKNYDLILVTRPDILLKCEIDLESVRQEIENYPYSNYMYAGYFISPKKGDTRMLKRWGASDCLFIIPPNILSVVAQIKESTIPFTLPYNVWGEDQFRYFMHGQNIIGRAWNYVGPLNWSIRRRNNEHSAFLDDLMLYMRKIIYSISDIMKLIMRRSDL